MASCGRLAIGLPRLNRRVPIALRAAEWDDNQDGPDTIRPQDAILPYTGVS
jgi:hypothetical protein